jgi:probable rRNA maturation factor
MPAISIFNRQTAHDVDVPAIQRLVEAALPLCASSAGQEDGTLTSLDDIEITLVDDAEIAGVHHQFLHDPSPTDVITFHHGEILANVEMAAREAPHHRQPLLRELTLYLIHGLLHLHGHTDRQQADRQKMHETQEKILDLVWPRSHRPSDRVPMPLDDDNWLAFRNQLVALAKQGDHGWLDADEIQSVLKEAFRHGLSPQLIISCRAATSTNDEFARRLDTIVRDTPIRILCIDDEKPFLNLLKLNLSKTGRYHVRGETDSSKWRETIREFRPQLVVLDMVMPGIDGREILRTLRADPQTKRIPVIVLTAILQDSDADAVNKNGILFLAKPVGLKALVHCIEEHLAASGTVS